MSNKNSLLLSLAWIALCLIRIGGRWTDLYWFLFTISSSDPRELDSIDSFRVWNASDAMLWMIGLIVFSSFAFAALLRIRKSKNLTSETQQVASK